MMRLFVVMLLLVLSAAPAFAQAEDTADEYKNVPEGLLLPAQKSSETATENGDAITAVMPMSDLLAAYKRGEYDLVFKHLRVILRGSDYPQADQLAGVMYRSGQGVEKDPAKAIEHLTKAAEAGLPLAQHYLGAMLYAGEGGPVDPIGALMWLQIASVTYPPGPPRARAEQDRDNLSTQISRRDRERAAALADEWLDRHGLKK